MIINMVELKEVFQKELLWKNIDHEIYRVYKFPVGKVKIKHPVLLNVSKSGGHRILDAKNVSHYIPFKWIEIRFETDDNVAWRF